MAGYILTTIKQNRITTAFLKITQSCGFNSSHLSLKLEFRIKKWSLLRHWMSTVSSPGGNTNDTHRNKSFASQVRLRFSVPSSCSWGDDQLNIDPLTEVVLSSSVPIRTLRTSAMSMLEYCSSDGSMSSGLKPLPVGEGYCAGLLMIVEGLWDDEEGERAVEGLRMAEGGVDKVESNIPNADFRRIVGREVPPSNGSDQ